MKIPPLALPDGERRRQAVDAIRGYVYQLVSSALAWASLGDDEALLLEVAEDYAVMAAEALTTIQVKDTPSKRVSLNSKSVIDALNHHWSLKALNSGIRVRMVYLTTSDVAAESPAIPGGVGPGLSAWRAAASDVAVAARLQAHLVSVSGLDEAFRQWIAEASVEIFQRDLVRRVRWDCGQPDLRALDGLLSDKLVKMGDRLSVPPMESRRARHSILHAVLLSASDPTDRILTRARLLETFAGAVTVTVPFATLQALIAARPIPAPIPPSLFFEVGAIPASEATVERLDLAGDVETAVAKVHPVWLHGPSGTGKTTAAVAQGRKSNRAWRLTELRGLSGEALAERLRVARAVAEDPETGGLILDDFPADRLRDHRLILALLAGDLDGNDASLVITSDRPPELAVTDQIGQVFEPVLVSNLTEDEVSACVVRASGDPEVWTRVVWLSTGGHPQLVAARVAGLKRRRWPLDETMQGLLADEAAAEVDDARRAVRVRLMRELEPDLRRLLYRLSVPLGGFDRALAMSVAAADPALGMPGEAFDFLIGPWLETSRKDRYRVSPLVSDSGAQTFSKTEVTAIHSAICRDLAARRPLQGDYLSQMLISGLLAQDAKALQLVVLGVIGAREEDYPALAFALDHLALFATDRWLLEWDHDLSARLRLAQLKVAVIKGQGERALAIYNRLDVEARSFEEAAPFIAAASVTVFSGDRNLFMPRDWFRVVRSLEGQTISLTEAERTRLTGQTGYAASDRMSDFMFVWAATRLRTVAELEDLFEVLAATEAAVRDQYLGTLDDLWVSQRTLVQTPWVYEADAEGFSAQAVAERYRRLAALAETWGQETLSIECIAAQAILLSEYGGQHRAALDILSGAQGRWPGRPRIARERTKILFSLERFEEVVAEGQDYLQTTGGDPLERIYALRERALALNHLSRLMEAADAFGLAADAAGILPPAGGMKAALIADRAFIEFQDGRHETALLSLLQAAREAEAVDRESARGGFVVRMLAGMGSWMVAQLRSSPPDPGIGMIAGACSGPEASGDWPGPVPQKEVVWYEIAAIERMLGRDLGLRAIVGRRVEGRRIGVFEVAFALEALVLLAREADPLVFVDACGDAARIFLILAQGGLADPAWGIHQITETMPWAHLPVDLTLDEVRLPIEDALITFMADCVLVRRIDPSQDLAAALFGEPAFNVQAGRILCWAQRDGPGSDAMTSTLWALSVIGGPRTADADSLALATFRMWEWLGRSSSAQEMADTLCGAIKDQWLHLIAHAPFALKRPTSTGPGLQAAARALENRSGIARLLLEADGAIALRMGVEVREGLRASIAADIRPA